MLRRLLPLLFASLAWSGNVELMEPFRAFDQAGLKPIYALFQADSQGRTLLRRACRKLGFKGVSQLKGIFRFGSSPDMFESQRGLYRYTISQVYRLRDESEWQDLTPQTLAKLADPNRFPVMDSHSWFTRNFEHRQIVFQPQILVKPGLSVLETYLVLYHELTHLVKTDPFERTDIMSFDEASKESDYFFKELERPGGELEAYLAQIAAFDRVRERYQVPAEVVLERFLTGKGRLLYRNRAAFLRHLLYEGGYQQQLQYQLDAEIVDTYNTAYVWWQFFDGNIAILQDNLVILDSAINDQAAQLRKAREEGWETEQMKAALNEFKQKRTHFSRRLQSYTRARKERANQMERLDLRFPRLD